MNDTDKSREIIVKLSCMGKNELIAAIIRLSDAHVESDDWAKKKELSALHDLAREIGRFKFGRNTFEHDLDLACSK